MSLFGFSSSSVEISIIFSDEDCRTKLDIKTSKNKRESFPLFLDGESLSGKILIKVKEGKRIEHQGIRVELIGDIEYHHDGERVKHNEFLSLAQELCSPAEFTQSQQYDFEFRNIDKPYESYLGTTVSLKYFIRVTISKRMNDIIQTRLFWVHHCLNDTNIPEIDRPISMEVGVDDCLHIEFRCDRSVYHLNGVIHGQVAFHLLRVKLQKMELSVLRREITGSIPHPSIENITLAKYEIMDGHPGKGKFLESIECPSNHLIGETIPIRAHLSGFDLSPTFQDINKKFSVRYFLNLILIDEENRRYFKQHEIILYRRKKNDALVHDNRI